MNVITLDDHQLIEESDALFRQIASYESIDIIIGIATGGVYISRPIKQLMNNKGWHGAYHELKLSRQSTKIKKKLNLRKILSRIPYFILNQLRTLEIFMSENLKAKEYDFSKEKRVFLSDALLNDIKVANSILLVDDAIDTGSTILAIKNVIKKVNAKIDVKVAVLTVTHRKPYIEPDFVLYRRVLLRCPWAEDYKGDDKIE